MALYRSHKTGLPLPSPLWFLYPHDKNTFGIDMQFFYGENILVSPVVEENSIHVNMYLPGDIFYDISSYKVIHGVGGSRWGI